jgi:hypothetical protein
MLTPAKARGRCATFPELVNVCQQLPAIARARSVNVCVRACRNSLRSSSTPPKLIFSLILSPGRRGLAAKQEKLSIFAHFFSEKTVSSVKCVLCGIYVLPRAGHGVAALAMRLRVGVLMLIRADAADVARRYWLQDEWRCCDQPSLRGESATTPIHCDNRSPALHSDPRCAL